MKNQFIVIEGLDGAGKTTQIRLLREALEEKGVRVHVSTEPTEYESGKALRRALSGKEPKTACEMAVMFTIDRIAHNQHPESGIEALLKDGCTVISDRYYYSSMAYQGSLTDEFWVDTLNRGCPEIRKPDLCIFLDLAPEKSMERITKNRSAEELEIYETLDRLTKVREKFLSVFDRLARETDPEKRENVVIINASGTIDEVAARIRTAVLG